MAYSALLLEDSSIQNSDIKENSSLNYVVQDYQDTSWKVCESYADVTIEREILNYDRPLISSSSSAFQMLSDYFIKEIETKEVFVVAYLDGSNKINLIKKMFSGGIDSTIVDIRLVVSTALLTLSKKVIIAHNHPSGRTQPSKSDIELTTKLKKALAYFEIELIDHVILTRNEYYSFRDEAILP